MSARTDHVQSIADACAMAAAMRDQLRLGVQPDAAYSGTTDNMGYDLALRPDGSVRVSLDSGLVDIGFVLPKSAAHHLACALVLLIGADEAKREAMNERNQRIAAQRGAAA